jgi:hypothetical protein
MVRSQRILPYNPESYRNMLLASSPAFSKDVGLIITFIGIGIVVNVIVVYMAIQIRGERQQNREHLSSRRRPPGS